MCLLPFIPFDGRKGAGHTDVLGFAVTGILPKGLGRIICRMRKTHQRAWCCRPFLPPIGACRERILFCSGAYLSFRTLDLPEHTKGFGVRSDRNAAGSRLQTRISINLRLFYAIEISVPLRKTGRKAIAWSKNR